MDTQPGRTLGRGMLLAACIMAMVFLTLFFGSVEEQQHNPNQAPVSLATQRSIDVVLERNRMGHYVFTGSINGQDVDFLLDTGASDVVIPMATARVLGLSFGPSSQAMTANGLTTVYATRLDRLTIGDIELHDVGASINASPQPGAILLGMSALKNIDFTQQGERLTLRQFTQ